MSFFARSLAMVILLCLAAASASPAGVSAAPAGPQPGAAFAIYPVGDHEQPWFDVAIDAGGDTQLVAGIRNAGDTPVSLATYATIATNPPNGGFAAGTADDEPAGLAAWIDYPATTLDLQPGETREIPFAVAIPAGTPPGEYVAALVVQTTEAMAIPGTDTFRQVVRSAVSVEVTVPGEMTAGFALGEPVITPTGSQWTLDVPIDNTGTARVRPRGELVVTAPDGTIVSTSRIEMGSVYGGNSTGVRVALPAHLPLGDYRVSLALTDEATGAGDAIEDVPITLAEPVTEERAIFEVDAASATPNADPIQYADIAATITNNGPAIPTATVILNVQRDGEAVERYPLAQHQALAEGTTALGQRYIPVDGWQPGTWTFELVILATGGGTETLLATVRIPGEIAVP